MRQIVFDDTFARANGPVGNEWQIGSGVTQAIASSKLSLSPGVLNPIVPNSYLLRPNNPARLQSTASVTIDASTSNQIVGLLLRGSVTGGNLSAYAAWWGLASHAVKMRSIVAGVAISTVTFPSTSPPAGHQLELVFSCNGSAPTGLTLTILDRSAGVTLQTVQWTDSAAALQQPGTVGLFSVVDTGGSDPVLVDDFQWQADLQSVTTSFSTSGAIMQIVGNALNSTLPMLAAYKTTLTTGAWHLRLYQNNVAPNPNMDVTQFTEATFTGYAAKTGMTWAVGPYINTVGQAELLDALYTWTPTGTTIGNTIYGWYLTDPTGAWVLAEQFNNPVPMASVLNTISLVLLLSLLQAGIGGDVQPQA